MKQTKEELAKEYAVKLAAEHTEQEEAELITQYKEQGGDFKLLYEILVTNLYRRL